VGDGVRVETDGLNKFSNQVQDDTTRTLETGYSRASMDFATGVQFGQNNASGGVHAAKDRYVKALVAHTSNIEEYLEAARVLASAASKVAAAFDATDSRSARGTQEVHDALMAAVQESQQRRAELDGHPTTRHGGARAI
jgi:hypothetical protein